MCVCVRECLLTDILDCVLVEAHHHFGPLVAINICRLIVGHTHFDIDQVGLGLGLDLGFLRHRTNTFILGYKYFYLRFYLRVQVLLS